MKIKEAIKKYTFVNAVEELRIHNSNKKDPLVISYNSLYYMQIIEYNPGCTISYIAELVGLSTSAVTMKVKELEKIGYIEKRQSTKDKRINHLYTTNLSQRDFAKFDNLRKDIYDNLSNKYTNEELLLFSDVLNAYSQLVIETSHEKYKMRLGEKDE